MSDDLHIPMPGAMPGTMSSRAPVSSPYRPRRVSAGLDPKWLAVAAAGLGGLLLLGFGGWAVIGRKPAAVPVIEADSRPLRVKPENPGGMQFAGADDVPGGADGMAPPAEVPNPQALRAQMQQPGTPSTPAAATPAPAAAAAAVVATAPGVGPGVGPGASPGASPLPDTPARPLTAVQAKPATAAKPPAPSAGGTQVQLAALDSEAGAQAEWARLSKRMPDLLGARRLLVQKAERDGQPVWRVRTGGFADTAEATGFCGKLRAKGASCTVASF